MYQHAIQDRLREGKAIFRDSFGCRTKEGFYDFWVFDTTLEKGTELNPKEGDISSTMVLIKVHTLKNFEPVGMALLIGVKGSPDIKEADYRLDRIVIFDHYKRLGYGVNLALLSAHFFNKISCSDRLTVGGAALWGKLYSLYYKDIERSISNILPIGSRTENKLESFGIVMGEAHDKLSLYGTAQEYKKFEQALIPIFFDYPFG